MTIFLSYLLFVFIFTALALSLYFGFQAIKLI
uniref:Cytochrome b6-f complex subunit 6 n=1 Tax=Crouania attenuata TaxID=42002 RepID=A0A4D6WQU3_9FLOR|nr:cytochrome b6-f complex subunit 6 [Crouania attenuata]